jgi:hypothetical protein
VPNHLATELQDLAPPTGLAVDLEVEDGQFVLGDSPGLGITIDEAAIAAAGKAPSGPTRTGPHIRPAQAGHRLDSEPFR